MYQAGRITVGLIVDGEKWLSHHATGRPLVGSDSPLSLACHVGGMVSQIHERRPDVTTAEIMAMWSRGKVTPTADDVAGIPEDMDARTNAVDRALPVFQNSDGEELFFYLLNSMRAHDTEELPVDIIREAFAETHSGGQMLS
jgi:hypothetical protein